MLKRFILCINRRHSDNLSYAKGTKNLKPDLYRHSACSSPLWLKWAHDDAGKVRKFKLSRRGQRDVELEAQKASRRKCGLCMKSEVTGYP